MTSDIFVDPERIRKFTSDLTGFRVQIDEFTDRIGNNLHRLSESWRDQEFEKFREAFDSAHRKLLKFSSEIEQTIPQLNRDAENAELLQGVIPPKTLG